MKQLVTRALCTLTAATIAAACAQKVPPAKAPLRPTEEEVVDTGPKQERTDCEPVTEITDDKPALKYAQRSVIEAQNLANQGFDALRAAEKPAVPKSQKERLVTQAVDDFITALRADPYNVHATYNLAAAYARIERFQCSINLLSRLEALRRLPSQADKVEAKLDRLFGRKKYKGALDPDFDDLRDDRRFRDLAEKLQ